ncbi:MAG TPA: hypothetical protein PKE26_17090 [Kiritimatiellia bacterium]|nr:hypothetical protein [Saprospiraceae bacterium]HMP00815.1 hypothetical protein [Kiritimatiellia bacterium]
MRDEFFKEQYSFHLDQRDGLLNTLSFVMIPYGLVLAGTAFYAGHFYDTLLPKLSAAGFNNCCITATLVILIVLLVLVVMTAYFIVRAFHNFEYEYLAPPEVIDSYYADLVTYHSQYPGQGSVDADFQKYLTNAYVSSAATNSRNNATRKRYCHLATRMLIYSIIASAVAYFPMMSLREEPGPQKVEITNRTLEVKKHDGPQRNTKPKQTTKPAITAP